MWVRDWRVEWFPVAITDEIAPSSLAVFAPVIDLGMVESLLGLTCIRLDWAAQWNWSSGRDSF
jgi:hypothetical protein